MTSGATDAATTPAVGGERNVPVPDPFARDYILLGLRLDQHIPGLVDGYFGPAALKAAQRADSDERSEVCRGSASATHRHTSTSPSTTEGRSTARRWRAGSRSWRPWLAIQRLCHISMTTATPSRD